MKTFFTISILAILIASSRAALAQDAAAAPPPDQFSYSAAQVSPSGDARMYGNAIAIAPRKEKASYLGVGIAPVPPELRAQLDLKPGFGLLVNFVERGSPSEAAGVKQYDILMKLNDQQMVDPDQLSTLVRAMQPGDAVTLTVIRGGKPITLNATIKEGEVPVKQSMNTGTMTLQGGGGAPGMTFPGLIFSNVPQEAQPFQVTPAAPADGVPWASAGNLRVLKDNYNGLTFLITVNNGNSQLIVCDAQNHLKFMGPMNTPEERSQIPADLRGTLDELMKKNHLKIEQPPTPSAPATPGFPTIPATAPSSNAVKLGFGRAQPS